MLLKEDGHLDIERVEQLSDEELEKEMEDWGNDELLEWERSKGTVSIDEFFEQVHQRIQELWHEDEEEQINTETKK